MGIDYLTEGGKRRRKMEKAAMRQVSQPDPRRTLKLKGPIAVVLNWVETVRSFCFQLVSVSPGR